MVYLVLRAQKTQIPHYDPLVVFEAEEDADEFVKTRTLLDKQNTFIYIPIAFRKFDERS